MICVETRSCAEYYDSNPIVSNESDKDRSGWQWERDSGDGTGFLDDSHER